jgi:hypothetical protein
MIQKALQYQTLAEPLRDDSHSTVLVKILNQLLVFHASPETELLPCPSLLFCVCVQRDTAYQSLGYPANGFLPPDLYR